MGHALKELPFGFIGGLRLFEKAGAPAGKERRIAGVISTETEDQEGEIVLQDGLDFSYFMSKGFFNDNHDKTIAGVVGYPEDLRRFRRGDKLPDGSLARSNCTWAEGALLKGDPRADSIWTKGLALQGTPRSLGFSVEGAVRARSGIDGKVVARGIVRHCAVTHMPVNDETRLRAFAKSLTAVENASSDDVDRAWEAFERALALGAPSPSLPTGPVAGDQGAARLLAVRDQPKGGSTRRQKKTLTKAEAVAMVRDRYIGITPETARRVVDVIARRWRTA